MEVDVAQERILGGEGRAAERTHEQRLRPKNFSEYVGQQKVLDNIKVMVESANIREEAMDHVLLYGPPGLGKTSLAMIMADALGTRPHLISGPAIEKKGDLASLLTNLSPRDVLFIDEIHRLPVAIEEILYSAMEDFRLDIVIGQGPGARTMQIDLPPFTLIGATTRSGLLSHPLRERFLAHLHFDFYKAQELEVIIANNTEKMGIHLDPQARGAIARCARGTPRVANRILRRVRDLIVVLGTSEVNLDQVLRALGLMGIDALGLDGMDRKILTVTRDYYGGGPVGIEALCATLGEDRLTVEDVYEPYLLKEGFLTRGPRGRAISKKGLNHLNEHGGPSSKT